jgi:TetR/AcrR family transcriptional regulator
MTHSKSTNSTKSTRGRRPGKQGTAREDILRAAIRSFTEHGFEGAKIAKIADLAGVRHPLVSYYFGSKQSLWDAVVEELWSGFWRSFKDAAVELQGIDPSQRLRLLYRRYALFSAAHPELHRLVALESFSPGPRLDRLAQDYYAPFEVTMLSVIEDAIEIENPPDPLYLMSMMNGAILSFIAAAPLVQRVHNFDPTEQSRALAMADAVMDIVLRGISKEKK